MFNLEIINDFIDKKAINSITVNEKLYQVDVKARKKMTRMLRNAGIITLVFFLCLGFITNKSFTVDIPFPVMMLLITLFFGSFSASRDEFKPMKKDYLFYEDELIIYKGEDFNEFSDIVQLDRIKYSDIKEISYNKIDKKMVINSTAETINYITAESAEDYEITYHETAEKNIVIYFNDETHSELINNFENHSGLKINII